MFARKLGRLAGLVFVLAAAFGGVAAVSAHDATESNAAAARSANSGPVQSSLGIEWD
ncbi:hypothetical protein KOI35_34405 [Actinoplanes bogorensis]|uniref:Uncharacterized protein n=1 Tax=Paractinoplanes bogorensis TaxID=1610840 RepID=A0ABS5YYU8_9ACTN|nr:hypothetical protein [Actinoplanes bogorensis]MBU2668615.1 hypothetical protein [Actinoplanes bogorensis]